MNITVTFDNQIETIQNIDGDMTLAQFKKKIISKFGLYEFEGHPERLKIKKGRVFVEDKDIYQKYKENTPIRDLDIKRAVNVTINHVPAKIIGKK